MIHLYFRRAIDVLMFQQQQCVCVSLVCCTVGCYLFVSVCVIIISVNDNE
eukprot:m.12731 g.12731  ORF g.12731 m.12731 type:complete len:50 (+) comp7311_c0_seq1:977-1126(+)